jgi:hypothetical protein
MITDATIKAITLLRESEHGWEFKFDKGSEDMLIDYLLNSFYETDRELGEQIQEAYQILQSRLDYYTQYSVTFGYNKVKFQIHDYGDGNPFSIYSDIAEKFNATEKLVYVYGYGWLNGRHVATEFEDCENSLGHYLELNWV